MKLHQVNFTYNREKWLRFMYLCKKEGTCAADKLRLFIDDQLEEVGDG